MGRTAIQFTSTPPNAGATSTSDVSAAYIRWKVPDTEEQISGNGTQLRRIYIFLVLWTVTRKAAIRRVRFRVSHNTGSSAGDGRYAFKSICDTDSLWVSNLFVDLARTSSPATSHLLYNARPTHHQATNVNLILTWYAFLGGNAEEETFWAVDKLYVILSSLFLSIHSS